MTFPIVELLCPQCGKPMVLTNTPELVECKVSGYDLMAEYHYKCMTNEEGIKGKEWCDISIADCITVMRILIPKIGSM